MEGVEERVAALEHENRELRRALRMVTALATTACTAIGGSDDLSGLDAEGRVGFDGLDDGRRALGGDVAEVA